MRKLFVFISLSLATQTFATNYYVKNGGSDAAAGTSDGTAWASVSKVNSSTTTGDTIYFRRGDSFLGTLVPKTNCTYKGYSTGANPVITVVETLSGWNTSGNWTNTGTNQWRFATSYTWTTTILGDAYYAWAPTAGAVNSQYRWYHAGMNDPVSSGQLTVYATSNPASYYSSIKISGPNYTQPLYVSGINGWTIDSVDFQGGAVHTSDSCAVVFTNCDNVTFRGCDLGRYAAAGAVRINGQSDNVKFYYCTFDRRDASHDNNAENYWTGAESWNGTGNGVLVMGGNNMLFSHCIFKNNRHDNINVFPGGYDGNHTNAATGQGDGSTCQNMTIEYCDFTSGTSDYCRAIDTHGWNRNQTTGLIVRYNRIHHTNTDAPLEISTYDGEFYYNLIDSNSAMSVWNSNPQELDAGAFAIFGNWEEGQRFTRNVKVYNNTFAYNGSYGLSIRVTGSDGSPMDSVYVYNNLFIDNGQDTRNNEGIGGQFFSNKPYPGGDPNWHLDIRNNLLYDSRITAWVSYNGYWTDGGHYNASAWNSADATTDNVSGNFTAVPSVDANFKLQTGSPAIDAGVSISGHTPDYFGSAVPNGSSRDIGYHEYYSGGGGGGAPATPTLSSPSSGATNQAVATTIYWNASATATKYHYQVSTSVSFASIDYQDSNFTAGTSVGLNLSNSTTYYWRVRAANANGWSTYSTEWYFTTTSETITPSNIVIAAVSQNDNPNTHKYTAMPYSGTATTNRYAFVGTASWWATSSTLDSVKFKTANLKLGLLGRQTSINHSVLEFWGIKTPPSGTDSIQFYWADSVVESVHGAITMTGVDTVSPTRTFASTTGQGTTATLTPVEAQSGDLIIAALDSWNYTYTPGPNQDSVAFVNGTNADDTDLYLTKKGTSVTNSVSYNISTYQNYALAAIAFKPAGGSAPPAGTKVRMLLRRH